MTALTVLVPLGWILGWVMLGRADPVPAPQAPLTSSVSVVVPARNEARRLPPLLAALTADPSPGRAVLVVDDGSTDGTAALARAAGVTVVEAGEPPAGWTGKAHACAVGAAASAGEVLVFVDADVVPRPGAIDRLAARAVATGGLVSVQPWHRVERAYEVFSAIPNVVAVLGAGRGRGHIRHWERAAAYGPALAIPRSAYLRFGGHEAVRGAVVDDLALARAAREQGVAVEAHAGGRDFSYRMYPEGLGSLVEGWSKNLVAGAGAVAPARAAAIGLWVTAALVSGLGLLGWGTLGGVAFVAFAAQMAVMLRRVGRFVASAPLYPLLLVAFVVLCLVSISKRGRGRASWRSRTVELRGEST